MHTQQPTYIGDAAELDSQLEHGVNEIRRALYCREITQAQAAELRESLLEQHLDHMKVLRRNYFGGNDA